LHGLNTTVVGLINSAKGGVLAAAPPRGWMDQARTVRRPGRVIRISKDALDGPTPAERILFAALLMLALAGLLTPHAYNSLPAESILEVVFAAIFLVTRWRVANRVAVIMTLASLYLVTKLLLMLAYRPAGIADFAQAYKAYIYLIVLCLIAGSQCYSVERLARIVKLLTILFAFKYGYSFALGLGGRNHRPGLFAENNFELVLLIGVFYISYAA